MNKNKKMRLSPRLRAIADIAASFLEKDFKGEKLTVVDVGTDHAFLPVYLVQNKIAHKVIACDIAEKPLEAARNNIATYLDNKLAESVSLCLSDGLRQVEGCLADKTSPLAIVIAGMGGETIVEILKPSALAKKTVENKSTRLILQPMSKAAILREWLNKNGFFILGERLVFDRHSYPIIECCYSQNEASGQLASYVSDFEGIDNEEYFYEAGMLDRVEHLEYIRYVLNKRLFVKGIINRNNTEK